MKALVLIAPLFVCLSAVAQNAAQNAAPAALPDLPATPAQAAPARPSFALPKSPGGSQVVMPSRTDQPPTTPDTPEECYAPAVGLYGPQPKLAPELERTLVSYKSVAIYRIDTVWAHRMPRALNDPWVRAAKATVRFAILPNGSIDTPIVTVSSGRHDYDKHALDAIQEASPFDPLPTGMTRALPICMHFGYNMDPMKKPAGSWQDALPAAKP